MLMSGLQGGLNLVSLNSGPQKAENVPRVFVDPPREVYAQ
jgi:hypothetical protein